MSPTGSQSVIRRIDDDLREREAAGRDEPHSCRSEDSDEMMSHAVRSRADLDSPGK